MAKILVVDDDAMVRTTMSTILRHHGFEVELAINGKQGLAAFREAAPDLVITDIIMPEKEGLETIIEMRRVRPSIKIIAMSGGGRVGNSDFLRMAKSLGADAVIPKPFGPNDLLGCVKTCLAA
jgi:DNA-binding response OmpR family regulator